MEIVKVVQILSYVLCAFKTAIVYFLGTKLWNKKCLNIRTLAHFVYWFHHFRKGAFWIVFIIFPIIHIIIEILDIAKENWNDI